MLHKYSDIESGIEHYIDIKEIAYIERDVKEFNSATILLKKSPRVINVSDDIIEDILADLYEGSTCIHTKYK